ncbi:MAG: TldD/PmbA family protein [Candidatus Delongbacteria bacterium]|nr:TldD/PmbA family protein [Candidatus Delongbacteria bacterium]
MEDIRKFLKGIKNYTELRVQENISYELSFINGDCISNYKSKSRGIFARSYNEGYWGVSSAPFSENIQIENVLKDAVDNAVFLRNNSKKRDTSIITTKEQFEIFKDYGKAKSVLSDKEKLDFIKEIDNYIVKKYPLICSRNISLYGHESNKKLANSFGSFSNLIVPSTSLYINLTLNKDKANHELYDLIGNLGKMEDVFNDPKRLFDKVDLLYQNLEKKSLAVQAKSGVKDVIIGESIGGILAHEAIGHTTEADSVMTGSIANKYLGKQVAGSFLNIVDFAHTAFGEDCPVPVLVDDEGVKAKDAYLIKDGILTGYMHNRETAAYFDQELTGNARASAFNDIPLIRMRNTCILPGKDKLQDMISSIEDGYYLIQSGNGRAEKTSEFMFGVKFGFEIKNGKIGNAIKDTTVSGVAFDLLKTVTMISDEFKWAPFGGYCFKQQPISTSNGSPAIKCKINIGG